MWTALLIVKQQKMEVQFFLCPKILLETQVSKKVTTKELEQARAIMQVLKEGKTNNEVVNNLSSYARALLWTIFVFQIQHFGS